MSVIEGVGDEVLVVVGAFLLVCLMLLAWFSTHTRDIPLVSVIVVELSQRRMRNRNNGNNNTSEAGDASVSESLAENGTDTATENGGSTEQPVSSNNNADAVSVDENGEETASATQGSPGSVCPEPPSSAVSGGETQPGENDCSNSVPSESENTNVNSGNVEEEVTPAESETISTIPPYTPQAESSDEVRRRRVAYFENNTGQDRHKTQRDSLLGAQSEDTGSIRNEEMTQTQSHSRDSSSSNKTSTFSSPVGATASSETPVSSNSSPVSCGRTETPSSSSQASAAQESITRITGSTNPTSNETQPGFSPGNTQTGSSSGGAQSGSPAAGAERSEALGREEEEGEMEDATSQQIRVRLKYLNDTQRLVYAHPQETVGNFRRLHFSSELEDDKIVRFIFNGQDLRNDLSTLRAYNIADNSVVHCLITQNRRHETQAGRDANRHDTDVQMGTLLFPVFGIILGLVWYLRFSYKQYFNAMSTVSLAGVSFIYLLAFFSSARHRRHPHQHLD